VTLRDAAISYGERGWRVFPCSRLKVPYVKAWPTAATTDPARIARWWAEFPSASIGMPTGRLIVIDVDGDKGGLATPARDGSAGPRMARDAHRPDGPQGWRMPPVLHGSRGRGDTQRRGDTGQSRDRARYRRARSRRVRRAPSEPAQERSCVPVGRRRGARASAGVDGGPSASSLSSPAPHPPSVATESGTRRLRSSLSVSVSSRPMRAR
jgi:hypothetical protein